MTIDLKTGAPMINDDIHGTFQIYGAVLSKEALRFIAQESKKDDFLERKFKFVAVPCEYHGEVIGIEMLSADA